MYKSFFHKGFLKDLKKLPRRVFTHADELTLKIAEYPYCSEKLSGNLNFIFRHKFRVDKVDYRLAYTVNEEEKSIHFLMIQKRERFYEQLKNRVLE